MGDVVEHTAQNISSYHGLGQDNQPGSQSEADKPDEEGIHDRMIDGLRQRSSVVKVLSGVGKKDRVAVINRDPQR